MAIKLCLVIACISFGFAMGGWVRADELNARSFGQDCQYAQKMSAGDSLTPLQLEKGLSCLQFLKGFRAAWVMQAIMVERAGMEPFSICFPKSGQSGREQNDEMIDIVVKYIHDNPLMGNKVTELAVFGAFQAYYPCKGQ